VQHVGREISKEFALVDFERSPPTLILVPAFIHKKNNGGNKQGLYQF